jgi:hypothetical protein
LRIESYFQQIRQVIEVCPILQSSNLTYDKRGTYEGLVRGELYFVDGSILHLREFVDTETVADRLMYVYQYMNAAKTMVFRYDNSGHHRELGLSTFPHHKHDGSAGSVVGSAAPGLATVLDEIEALVQLP